MTISADMRARYTSEVDVDWRHAFALYHPSAGWRYLIDHTEHFVGIIGDPNEANPQTATFQPVPAQITFPGRDQSGRADMGITWCGIGEEALEYLNAAIVDGTKPIQCFYTIYLLGSQIPQIFPYVEFRLTGISATEEMVTASASQNDVINSKFPRLIYRIDKFPGLRRR